MENIEIRGKANCPFCTGSGYRFGDWGNKVLCSCVIEQQNEADEQQVKTKPVTATPIKTSAEDMPVLLHQAIIDGILSVGDVRLEYNRGYAIRSIKERSDALRLVITKKEVAACLDAMDLILTDLQTSGKLPDRSYAIGTDMGVGKTTFATTVMKNAALQNYSIVPLVDMSTLTEKYIDYATEMRKQLSNMTTGTISNENTSKKKEFGWKEYIDADLVIASLTGGNEDVAYSELYTLHQLLLRRSAKLRPTIILMNTPTDYYDFNNIELRRLLGDVFAPANKPGTYQLLEMHSIFLRERRVD